MDLLKILRKLLVDNSQSITEINKPTLRQSATSNQQNVNPDSLIKQFPSEVRNGRFMFFTKEGKELLTEPIFGLFAAQSLAENIANRSNKIIQIYEFVSDKWVWVDKIYPSEYAN